MLLTAWNTVLEHIAARRSSLVLMPIALATVVRLAEQGKIENGEVAWRDFEPAFRELVSPYGAKRSKEAWLPYYHLSGRVGLWELRKGSSPATFDDLPKKKPSSAARLRARVEHARLGADLARELGSPDVRAELQRRINDLLPPVGC